MTNDFEGYGGGMYPNPSTFGSAPLSHVRASLVANGEIQQRSDADASSRLTIKPLINGSEVGSPASNGAHHGFAQDPLLGLCWGDLTRDEIAEVVNPTQVYKMPELPWKSDDEHPPNGFRKLQFGSITATVNGNQGAAVTYRGNIKPPPASLTTSVSDSAVTFIPAAPNSYPVDPRIMGTPLTTPPPPLGGVPNIYFAPHTIPIMQARWFPQMLSPQTQAVTIIPQYIPQSMPHSQPHHLPPQPQNDSPQKPRHRAASSGNVAKGGPTKDSKVEMGNGEVEDTKLENGGAGSVSTQAAEEQAKDPHPKSPISAASPVTNSTSPQTPPPIQTDSTYAGSKPVSPVSYTSAAHSPKEVHPSSVPQVNGHDTAPASPTSVTSQGTSISTATTAAAATATAAPIVKQAPRSFAEAARARAALASASGAAAPTKAALAPLRPVGISDSIKSYVPNLKSRLIKPRGLINNGNMCFMNAILQPLVHCAPFYNFFMQFRHAYTMSLKTKTPLLEATIMFLNEFREASRDSPKEQKSPSEEANSESFAPEYVYDALRALKKLDNQKGRQEDAEEFLGFLLDGLHEELLSVMNSGVQDAKSSVNPSSDDEWTQVGRKNKPTVFRSTEVAESPIYHIFGGRMRSVLKSSGNKQSATLEPFQSLQIDIASDQVETIEDGLRRLTAVEILEGFTSNKGGKVDATKQNLIESLPPILILHLKRFHYDSTTGTTQKLQKHIAYSATLKIDPEIISPTARKDVGSNTEYRLFAVVNHHGKQTTGGHYTCDVARGSTGEWLRMDDTVIKPVPVNDVLVGKSDRQAYMLFFCKS